MSTIESTQFVLDLVKNLFIPGNNLVLSPYSLASALVMLIAGADGNTQTELVKVMFDEKTDGSNGDKHVKAFAETNKAMMASNGATLKIANLLYTDKSFQLKPDYVSTLSEQLHAIAKQLDFVGGQAEAVGVINSDVSQATNGLIPSSISRIHEDTVLIVVNAIYFKDIWMSPFDKKLTTETGEFHTLPDKVVKTALMHKSYGFKFYQDSETGMKAVQLDYQHKGNIALVLILPQEGVTMDTYLKTQLTATSLEHILRSLGSGFSVNLTLPRFRLDFTLQLVQSLIQSGVRDMFDPTKANLTRISSSSKPIWVSQIVQNAVIEVNEEGTEAAAATLKGSVRGGSSRVPIQVDFTANRPFLFALVTKDVYQQVLFIGVVEDPSM